jgi:LysR family transcriptional regulator, transcriptional activator of nhaA
MHKIKSIILRESFDFLYTPHWRATLQRLNYHHLMYFREIALSGSISKAALRLGVGQPAISAQLKTLEASVGQNLFERINRGLVLTEAGKFALQMANEIYQSGNNLLEVMEKKVLSSRVQLNLGVLDSVPKHMILKLIRDARDICDCHVTIIEGRTGDLLRQLSNHALDLLITNCRAPFSDEGEAYSRLLGKSKIALFGAPEKKRLCRNFPRSLDGELMVVPTNDSQLRHDIDHYFRLNNLHIPIFAETQDTSIQKLVAAEGFALTPLPEFSAKEMVRERKLINIGIMEDVWEEFWIVSVQRTIDNPVALKLARDFQFTFEN